MTVVAVIGLVVVEDDELLFVRDVAEVVPEAVLLLVREDVELVELAFQVQGIQCGNIDGMQVIALAEEGIENHIVISRGILVVKYQEDTVGLAHDIKHILCSSNGKEYGLGLMRTKINHVVGLLGNTDYPIGGSGNVNVLSDR